jgi:uncharacterized lipoprotein YmbA
MKPPFAFRLLPFALAALLLTGCAHTTDRTGTIQLPPVEYVR